jgi:microcystin-dependent protein
MAIIAPLPYNIANGDPIDATPPMANFNQIVANVNSNAAGLTVQNTFTQPQNGVAAILPAQLTTLAQVQALLQASVPAGTIIDYAVAGAPTGYLACDGSAVSRTTYAILFTAIGTVWGPGDGSTTFNVPDLRRAATVGAGGTGTAYLANSVGSAGGAETHVIAATELPTHNHGVNDPTHAHSIYDPGHSHTVNDPGHAHSVADPGHAHTYTAPGSGTVVAAGINWNGSTQAASTAASGTGIGIYANTTGIYLSAAGTGVQTYAASTGITTQNAGSSAAMNMYPPVRVVTKMIRTGL